MKLSKKFVLVRAEITLSSAGLYDQFTGSPRQGIPRDRTGRQGLVFDLFKQVAHRPECVSLCLPSRQQLLEYGGKFLAFKLGMQSEDMVAWCSRQIEYGVGDIRQFHSLAADAAT